MSKTQQVLLAHGRWSMENLNVNDPGLKRYICVKPVAVFHTGGRHEHRRFGKVSVPIVERLINKMMHPGKNMGKKHLNTNIALQALEIIHLRTKDNPLQVLIRAIENSALREETTRIAYGGIVYHQSVDISPLRRLDIALKHMADGARAAAFSKPKTIEECLADEILLAASYDSKSFAVARREELERIALSARSELAAAVPVLLSSLRDNYEVFHSLVAILPEKCKRRRVIILNVTSDYCGACHV